ncbi:MAG: cytochrome c oxidase subunit II [Bacteriovorax sp.]|jgi:cytochrome c oxidase subunit 2|nr:cytochrome c oxidase subunit II [Bacteriovorax sp.]
MNLYSLYMKLITINANASEMSLWERMKPPVDISTNGHLIDSLFNLTTMLILFFFVLVCLGLFGFSYLYRKSKHPKPLYVHGTSKKHIAIVAGIGALVFIVIDMQITGISNRDYMEVFAKWPKETEDVVRVEVLGQQWAWNFRYAGKDGIFNTEDDIVTLNDLRLPIGRKIVFQVTAKDVIHSFSLPNTRLKTDAMPGRISKMWVELTKTGVYDIVCAQICGTFHYRMQAKMTVYSQEEFKKWEEEMQNRTSYAVEKDNADLYWGWKWLANN